VHSTTATALDGARVAVLQARSNESLVLVARSGGSADQGFTTQLDRVLGPDGLLTAAGPHADGIRAAAQEWRQAHEQVRAFDDGGRYAAAVASVTGQDPAGSGATFSRLDTLLGRAVDAERAAFDADAAAATTALTGLTGGPAVLAVLACAGVLIGIGRRVGEYR
jgi:hypothetical protein